MIGASRRTVHAEAVQWRGAPTLLGARPGPGWFLALALVCGACGGEPEGHAVAGIVFAVEADELTCADFCVEFVTVAIYRVGEVFPLGPAQTVACGAAVSFTELPAGTEVLVQATMTSGPTTLLSGLSEPVTVSAGGVKEVSVPLAPPEAPVVTSLSPEPMVLGQGETLALSGEGLGFGGGLAAVELDGVPLDLAPDEITWNGGEVTVALPAGARGSAVAVRSCGVATAPVPLRLVGSAPQQSTFTLPGCEGLDIRALAPAGGGGDVRVAAACPSTGTGRLLSLLAGCTQAPDSVTLASGPVDVAVDPAGADAWVALEDGAVVRVPVGADQAVPTAWDGAVLTPRALATSPMAVHVIGQDALGATSVYALDSGSSHQQKEIGPGLELIDLVWAGPELLVVGRHPDGVGKLIVVPLGGGGLVSEWVLPECDDPRALDTRNVADGPPDDPGAEWVAITCGGSSPGVQAFARSDDHTEFIPLPGFTGGPVAVDTVGDAALVRDAQGGELWAVHLPTRRVLASWSLSAPSVTGTAVVGAGEDHRFALTGPGTGELTLLSPYQGAAPCP